MKTNPIIFFVSFIFLLTLSSVNQLFAQKNSDKFIVVLDAGHGGKDPGKHSKYGYKEKDIALNIVLQVGKALEKNPNIKVVYTRKTDVFVDLFKRGKIANEAKADLFVSVHCNAHTSQAYGSETYVLGIHRNETNFNVAKSENEVIYLEDDYEQNYQGFDPNSPDSFIGLTLMQEEYLDQSILLASFVQNNFTQKLKRKNRGVKQAGFIVLHQTIMPSVLIETGFVTNKSEGAYLNSKKGQTEISNSIEKAVLDYKNAIYQNVDDISSIASSKVVKEEPAQVYKDIVFKVQIAASSKKLATKSYNFNGLDDISRDQEGALYKYYYGNTSDYTRIKQLQDSAKSKGYNSCFIVAFKNGNKISLTEALKTTTN
ncbi:N-acetylmuramoyl-L-alanine amidase family protein [Corallibacter sp.]|uniref:N-acetylmuramoyl-L-alanine amidase family protein n=1 Tax=Corallibacter sp. TaxID=2038084 RepID=UPI003AB804D5